MINDGKLSVSIRIKLDSLSACLDVLYLPVSHVSLFGISFGIQCHVTFLRLSGDQLYSTNTSSPGICMFAGAWTCQILWSLWENVGTQIMKDCLVASIKH